MSTFPKARNLIALNGSEVYASNVKQHNHLTLYLPKTIFKRCLDAALTQQEIKSRAYAFVKPLIFAIAPNLSKPNWNGRSFYLGYIVNTPSLCLWQWTRSRKERSNKMYNFSETGEIP
jgi:hypothetical protein